MYRLHNQFLIPCPAPQQRQHVCFGHCTLFVLGEVEDASCSKTSSRKRYQELGLSEPKSMQSPQEATSHPVKNTGFIPLTQAMTTVEKAVPQGRVLLCYSSGF